MKKRSSQDPADADWTATGSFMNKPKHGWYHTNEEIARGVSYRAVYVGCMKILRSVKSLSLDDRSAAIHEATARCCDKAGLVKYKKRTIPPSLSKAFGDVFGGYRGENILIKISKTNVRIILEKTGVLICDHFIENISFASGGEKKYSAFVSYIAKDNVFERACFVIQCENGCKSEVIQSIGQAFEAKYKDFVNKPLVATEIPEKFSQPVFPVEDNASASQPGYAPLQRDGEMSSSYSKLHGNERKDVNTNGYARLKREDTVQSCSSAASHDYSQLQRGFLNQDKESNYNKLHAVSSSQPHGNLHIPVIAGAEYDKIKLPGNFTAVYDNPMASPTSRDKVMIDFNDNSPEYQQIPATKEALYDCPKDLMASKPVTPYDNPKDLMKQAGYQEPTNPAAKWEQFDDAATPQKQLPVGYMDLGGYLVPSKATHESAKYASLHHDSEDSAEYQSPEEVADYQRPKNTEYQPPDTHYQVPKSASGERPKSYVGPLENKPWFHGSISRIDAEMLIENDGQFLIRESGSSKGQYVMSGMKDNQHRHLLLVDPQGQIRTKDRTFATVEDLISYHQNNNLPIISGGSEVRIVTPVFTKSQGNNNARPNHSDSFKI